jgi:hypothetical protein
MVFADPTDVLSVAKMADASVGWASATRFHTSPAAIRGTGSVALANGTKGVYLGGSAAAEALTISDAASANITIYGLQQRFSADSSGNATPVGAAWMAWAERVTGTGQNYSALLVGCSPTPDNGGSWRKSVDFSPIAAGDRNSGIVIDDMKIASNDSLAAIAVRTTLGSPQQVYYATFPNTCSSLPASLTWSAPVATSTTAIALAPDGTFWKPQ